jgi:HAD superfamily hydrolase (TIGR01509 family)
MIIRPPQLLIFDFDGVVADSEPLAITVAAAYANELGYPVTLEQAFAAFVGRRASEVRQLIENHTGASIPTFESTLLDRTIAAFQDQLMPIQGVREFIVAYNDIPRCIASSSAHRRLEASLATIDMLDMFAGRVFSADDVARGKPFPDLFLFAARQMAVEAEAALVIEDSPHGVEAARAAGMTAIGLIAGGHVPADLADRLRQAGAERVVHSYAELADLIGQ